MSKSLCAALLGGLVMVACATEKKQLPAALDPSNPEAPESAAPEVRLAQDPAIALSSHPPPADDRAAQQHGAAATVPAPSDAGVALYTCPMHPEVMQSTPGRCPKCGMNL